MLRYKMFPVEYKKNYEAGNSFNAVEREPVPTRVLNPNILATKRFIPKWFCNVAKCIFINCERNAVLPVLKTFQNMCCRREVI